MRLRFRQSRLRVLLLAATLVVGQWLLAHHLAQVEAHATPDGCEWCLTHAPLAGALPARTAVALPPAVERPPLVSIATAPAAGFRLAPAARAPPRFLVV
jgi:hypothetical protein